MSEFSEANVETIIAACGENSAAIAESLNQCFDSKYRIEVGESGIWNADEAPAELGTAGLVVGFEVGTQAIVCLIPASMPLPEWYTHPGDSEESRLQTLAMEWSMNMLPGDLEAGKFESVAVEDLKQAVSDATPLDWAAMIELLVFDEASEDKAGESEPGESDQPAEATEEVEATDAADSATADSGEETPDSDDEASETTGEAAEDASSEADEGSAKSAQPVAKLFVVWPLEKLPTAPEQDPESDQSEAAPAAGAIEPSAAVPGASAIPAGAGVPAAGIQPGISKEARRMLGLSVTVVVQLAEKKIEMGQLLSLTPGALVTFNKSCEDLLDLYVNNHRYCRGEAVKIGEKFGMKISEVGVVEIREERIFE